MLSSKRYALCVAVALAAALTFTLPAQAADGPELLPNADVETGEAGTGEPVGWTASSWRAANATWSHTFQYVETGGHSGSKSVMVTISGYTGIGSGDAKWIVDPDPNSHPGQGVPVEGGKYYTYSDWYRSDTGTVASVWYLLASDPPGSEGHWANLYNAIPPSSTWTQYTTGFKMPANATRAYFAHLLAGNGYLQTDDYSMRETSAPTGFGRPLISLTFDNGSHGTYERAIPEMDARGLTSTQYFPTAQLDPFDDWSMTEAQIREISLKHEIGAHSVTHPFLTQLSADALEDEIVNSRTLLEGILDEPGAVTSFAYPYGDYNATVIAALKAHGYTSARAVDVGYNGPADLKDPFAMKVQNVTPATTVADFAGWVDQAVAGNYWLIVVFHEVLPENQPVPSCEKQDVDPCEDPFDTYETAFRGMMESLVTSHRVPNVVTVSRGVELATNRFPTGTVTLTPANPATGAVVTAHPSFTDPDGDELTPSYQWFRDGVTIPGATHATLDLSQPGHGDRGETISVSVTVVDGNDGNATAEASVSVANSAPVAGSVAITPASPKAGMALTAVPTAFADADEDRLSYAFTWQRNGRVVAGQTGATLPGSVGQAGDSITVTVRATDGHGGASAAVSRTVKLSNTTSSPPRDTAKPTVVVRAPKAARTYRKGRRLTIRFACTDESGAVAWSATLHRRGGGTRKVSPGKKVRLARAGSYVLRITAWDQAGNTTVKTIRFRVASTTTK